MHGRVPWRRSVPPGAWWHARRSTVPRLQRGRATPPSQAIEGGSTMAETSIFLAGNLTSDPSCTTAPAAPPGPPSGWPWPAGPAMPRAGGMVSRRSTRWWSGATRPCTPPSRSRRQPGRGHRPAGAAVLAGRRRHRPLGGRGRGQRAGTEPSLGNGNHDQVDAEPRRVTITGAASLRMVKRDAGRWAPLTRRRSASSRQAGAPLPVCGMVGQSRAALEGSSGYRAAHAPIRSPCGACRYCELRWQSYPAMGAGRCHHRRRRHGCRRRAGVESAAARRSGCVGAPCADGFSRQLPVPVRQSPG
jgi:hypothetical protein